jgi:hypothetical protein
MSEEIDITKLVDQIFYNIKTGTICFFVYQFPDRKDIVSLCVGKINKDRRHIIELPIEDEGRKQCQKKEN